MRFIEKTDISDVHTQQSLINYSFPKHGMTRQQTYL